MGQLSLACNCWHLSFTRVRVRTCKDAMDTSGAAPDRVLSFLSTYLECEPQYRKESPTRHGWVFYVSGRELSTLSAAEEDLGSLSEQLLGLKSCE
jgi:hypothetical protein